MTDSPSSSAPGSGVLIVGAGPSGLVLALWLARLGVRARIIDRNAAPASYSRALGVHARTLEFYRQLGFADEVVHGGVVAGSANLWSKGHRVARAPFGDIGRGMTRYPFVLDFAQDQHERLLIDKLAEVGVQVERGLELAALAQDKSGVSVTLRSTDGSVAEHRCAYVAGCDGTHSTTREALGVAFGGGTYERLFYVADAVGSGPAVDDGVHVDLDDAELLVIFQMKGEGHFRLVGTILEEAVARKGHELTFNDVARRPIEHLRLAVNEVRWFSTYHVHHRVADHFRVGRCFLVGDAAHVHSPVGAQGMNTGIGDAVNLSWKLAAVLGDAADPALLDTYESERMAFAKQLVATTDRAFEIATRQGALAAFVRTKIFPRFVTLFFTLKPTRRFLFKAVSQIGISYRESPLSKGQAGAVVAGDRLPWVATEAEVDNHTPLSSLRWQVHMYGGLTPQVQRICGERKIEAHGFPWERAMDRAGLAPGAVYLIRPDGYVAFADQDAKVERLEEFLNQWRIQSA